MKSKRKRLKRVASPLELRHNEDGTLDEMVMRVSRDVWFHLEQMDDGCWFLNVTDGKTEAHGFLHTKRGAAILANFETYGYQRPIILRHCRKLGRGK